MVSLNKITDYCILLMAQMAGDEPEGQLLASNDLALATHIPSPTVSKVLQALLAAGLLESIRGARGGYRLSRPAKDISVRQIINSLEGHIALTECKVDGCECEQMPYCSTHNNWKRINQAVRDVLENISLEDMTSSDFMPIFSLKNTLPIEVM